MQNLFVNPREKYANFLSNREFFLHSQQAKKLIGAKNLLALGPDGARLKPLAWT
jgi:hypothetical protein